MTSPELARSPLDATRYAMQAAASLDEMAGEVSGHQMGANQDYFVEEIHGIDASHPLLGRNVVMHGPVLPTILGDEGLTLGLPQLDIDYFQQEPVRGIYYGASLVNVGDESTGGSRYHIVHALETGSSEHLDPLGSVVNTRNFVFVCADGAVMEAVNCIDEHSLADLEKFKGVMQGIDEQAFADAALALTTIRNIGKIGDSFFKKNTDRSLQRQVVSYINSLNILEGRRITAVDFVVSDELFYGGSSSRGPITMSDMKTDVVAYPHSFTIANRYERTEEDGVPYVVDKDAQPQLCVAATAYDGSSIIVPVNNITNAD